MRGATFIEPAAPTTSSQQEADLQALVA
jgi:hypothetical protein